MRATGRRSPAPRETHQPRVIEPLLNERAQRFEIAEVGHRIERGSEALVSAQRGALEVEPTESFALTERIRVRLTEAERSFVDSAATTAAFRADAGGGTNRVGHASDIPPSRFRGSRREAGPNASRKYGGNTAGTLVARGSRW